MQGFVAIARVLGVILGLYFLGNTIAAGITGFVRIYEIPVPLIVSGTLAVSATGIFRKKLYFCAFSTVILALFLVCIIGWVVYKILTNDDYIIFEPIFFTIMIVALFTVAGNIVYNARNYSDQRKQHLQYRKSNETGDDSKTK